ncbi:hypothetical protein L1049_005723 [Liquidambar formosana]|uniref:Uncharacterized protein n=1 Tax=Liquidambar formosana TaxID=63359 RepID=A0AAP0RE50_LIQFO
MAPHSLLSLLLPALAILFARVLADDSLESALLYPLYCSAEIKTCDSMLYHIDNDLSKEQLAYFYSVNTSQIRSIVHRNKHDYLITVPCSCKDINGTSTYIYDTTYRVQPNDTFVNLSYQIYSGQALKVGGEENSFVAGNEVSIPLVCGCIEGSSQIVVTYTVQENDTLSNIASLLSSTVSGIESMNKNLTQNPDIIDVDWVLFVPMEKNAIPNQGAGKRQKWTVIIGVLSTVTLLSMSALIVILLRKNRFQQNSEEDPKAVSKILSAKRTFSLQNQHLHNENMEDVTAFESERPVIFSLKEIEEATNNFDETRKIGEGGYGSVYFGVLGEQEVAIKKMRSNKTKEFFAELKVLCKIHHINVVELLGYASGDDHLYLVYEYVRNGSLNDHLHDPLLKVSCISHNLYFSERSVKELQVTTKTDVFAFGVVLGELITGQRALIRDNRKPNRMKSLVTVVKEIFQDEDPVTALEAVIDGNLKGSYPMEDVYKVAEIAEWCLSDDAVNRPEMREIVVTLSQIMTSSVEWEASLGGRSQVFSGLFNGR